MPFTIPPPVIVTFPNAALQAPPDTLFDRVIGVPKHTFDGPVMVPTVGTMPTCSVAVVVAVPQVLV